MKGRFVTDDYGTLVFVVSDGYITDDYGNSVHFITDNYGDSVLVPAYLSVW
jgi:hypothetical protein